MELLEENKKYRSLIRKAREKRLGSSDVLTGMFRVCAEKLNPHHICIGIQSIVHEVVVNACAAHLHNN